MVHTKKETRAFLRHHIKKHEQELGMDHDQAVAVALHEAREKDYPGIKAMEKS